MTIEGPTARRRGPGRAQGPNRRGDGAASGPVRRLRSRVARCVPGLRAGRLASDPCMCTDPPPRYQASLPYQQPVCRCLDRPRTRSWGRRLTGRSLRRSTPIWPSTAGSGRHVRPGRIRSTHRTPTSESRGSGCDDHVGLASCVRRGVLADPKRVIARSCGRGGEKLRRLDRRHVDAAHLRLVY